MSKPQECDSCLLGLKEVKDWTGESLCPRSKVPFFSISFPPFLHPSLFFLPFFLSSFSFFLSSLPPFLHLFFLLSLPFLPSPFCPVCRPRESSCSPGAGPDRVSAERHTRSAAGAQPAMRDPQGHCAEPEVRTCCLFVFPPMLPEAKVSLKRTMGVLSPSLLEKEDLGEALRVSGLCSPLGS